MTRNLRGGITIPRAVFAALLLLVVLPPAADAQTKYGVNTLRYENKGGYVASVKVRYRNKAGDRDCEASLPHTIAKGHTVDYKLGGDNEYWEWSCISYPLPGDEVWMTIQIKFGDRQVCRKDSTKFVFRRDGGTVKYVTKGTTLKDNRCQIASKPSDDHIIR